MDGSLEKCEFAKPDGITVVYEVRNGHLQFAVYVYRVLPSDKETIQNELNRWDGLKVTSRKEVKDRKYEGIEIVATVIAKKEMSVYMHIVRSKNVIFNVMVISSEPLDAKERAIKERFFGSFVVK